MVMWSCVCVYVCVCVCVCVRITHSDGFGGCVSVERAGQTFDSGALLSVYARESGRVV